MEADTGKYVFSMDLGLQNVVTSIDPTDGRQDDRRSLVPGDGETKFVVSARRRRKVVAASSYNPRTKMLYVPLVESCMDLTPVAPGGRGSLSTGVRWSLRPRPNSDGNYGRIQAISLDTRKTVWIEPSAGAADDGHTGDSRRCGLRRRARSHVCGVRRHDWRGAVADAPRRRAEQRAHQLHGERPAVRGDGRRQRRRTGSTFPALVPEIRNPPDRGAAVWVFALPERGRR